MKVTRYFGLWALSVLCVFSCTDGEQGTGDIIPDVATKLVKLSLGTIYAGSRKRDPCPWR